MVTSGKDLSAYLTSVRFDSRMEAHMPETNSRTLDKPLIFDIQSCDSASCAHLVSMSLLPNDLLQTEHLCVFERLYSPTTEADLSRCRDAICFASRSWSMNACSYWQIRSLSETTSSHTECTLAGGINWEQSKWNRKSKVVYYTKLVRRFRKWKTESTMYILETFWGKYFLHSDSMSTNLTAVLTNITAWGYIRLRAASSPNRPCLWILHSDQGLLWIAMNNLAVVISNIKQ